MTAFGFSINNPSQKTIERWTWPPINTPVVMGGRKLIIRTRRYRWNRGSARFVVRGDLL